MKVRCDRCNVRSELVRDAQARKADPHVRCVNVLDGVACAGTLVRADRCRHCYPEDYPALAESEN